MEVRPDERLFAIVVALNLPYAVGAYLASRVGVVHYPRATPAEYWVASRQQVAGLSILLGVAMLTGVGARLHRSVRNCSMRVGLRSRGTELVCVVAAVVIGLHDGRILFLNRGSILGNGRHTFSEDYWLVNGAPQLVLGIALSVALLAGLLSRTAGSLSAVALVILWAPTILAGERNYAVLCLVVAAVIYLFREPDGHRRRQVVVAGMVVGVVFVFVPVLWADNPVVAANEWILPNSIWVPLATGMQDVAGVGATPWYAQWPLLLPGSMRPWAVTTTADSFNAAGLVNVNVGSNMWADVYPGTLWAGVAAFVAVSVLFPLLSVWMSRLKLIGSPLICVGVMATWGRWGSWGAIFVLVYTSILLSVLLSPQDAPTSTGARASERAGNA